MKKQIIWDNYNVDADAWAEDLRQEYPDLSNDELEELVWDLNNLYLSDERDNLDLTMPAEIIVIADLGTWQGRRDGYKIIKSGNIADCLYSRADFVTWYCDQYNFRAAEYHHDGTNYLLYRALRPELSEDQKDYFLYEVYRGRANDRMIRRYTTSLRPHIADVYGWKGGKQTCSASK